MGLIKASDPTACGIVGLDDSRKIVTFVEKPDRPKSDLANGGVFIAAAQFIDELEALILTKNNIADLGYDVLPHLVGKMFGYPIPEYLADIGTPQCYECALSRWKKIAMQAETR
jgi:NDP-sugar pyrophosphorylase family protein